MISVNHESIVTRCLKQATFLPTNATLLLTKTFSWSAHKLDRTFPINAETGSFLGNQVVVVTRRDQASQPTSQPWCRPARAQAINNVLWWHFKDRGSIFHRLLIDCVSDVTYGGHPRWPTHQYSVCQLVDHLTPFHPPIVVSTDCSRQKVFLETRSVLMVQLVWNDEDVLNCSRKFQPPSTTNPGGISITDSTLNPFILAGIQLWLSLPNFWPPLKNNINHIVFSIIPNGLCPHNQVNCFEISSSLICLVA